MQADSLPGFQEALTALGLSADAMDTQLRSARAAKPADRDTLIASRDTLLQTGRVVREALARLAEAAAEPAPEWDTRDELVASADRLAARAGELAANLWRLQLQEVATVLAVGQVFSRRTGRVNVSLDRLRNEAVTELTRIAGEEHPLRLPGESDGSW